MRFLHLTTFYPPYSFGGDAMYIYRLSHALADQGHQVDVVHCIDAYQLQHPGEPEVQFTEHPNVARHGVRTRAGFLSTLVTQQTGHPYLMQRELREIVTGQSYDVIHYHNISLLGADVLRWQPRGRAAIKLYTTHEHWLVCPMHVLWKYGRRACEKPACLRCTLLGKRPPQLWRYTGFLADASRHVDRFVSPSRFTATMHASRGFPQPVGVLPYFIDRADRDWQEPAPRPHARPYFLFVGRLEVIKGLQTLIQLWDQVPDYDLLVAGSGSYADELRRQAAGNALIRFLGPVSQRDLGALYYHALACIVPSVTFETFGVIIVEAFARKTPAIVRDLGALPEVIGDSGGGFIYRTDDELLDYICRLGQNPAERDELGGRGYDAFVRMWSREAHLRLYGELIESVEAGRHG
jgi:glycosyltransferase involved in cell wall biosynthesis